MDWDIQTVGFINHILETVHEVNHELVHRTFWQRFNGSHSQKMDGLIDTLRLRVRTGAGWLDYNFEHINPKVRQTLQGSIDLAKDMIVYHSRGTNPL